MAHEHPQARAGRARCAAPSACGRRGARVASVILLALLTGPVCARDYPSLTGDGGSEESACSDSQWPRLHEALVGVAASRRAEQLTGLVRLFLCAGEGGAADRLRRSASPRLTRSYWETGLVDPMRELIRPSGLSPLAGHAWTASVSESDGKVVISYRPNSACEASATFAFTRQRWRLTELGEGCD